jgi:molybdenum cofactor cytidylyltransferase
MTLSITAIVLAAGTSSRMGRPKQLLDWGGKTLLCHVAEVALASTVDEVVVVLNKDSGFRIQDSEIQRQQRDVLATLEAAGAKKLTIVDNEEYRSGQASSLKAGLAALAANSEAALVLLVDQPLVTPSLLNTLITAYRAANAWALIPRYKGQRGNPVLLGKPLFAELQQLQGDSGARAVLQRYREHIAWLDLDHPAIIADVDTPEAYHELYEKTFGRT